MPYLTLTLTENLKLQLSPGLVASYDIQQGKGVSLFWDKHTHVYLLTYLPRTHTAQSLVKKTCKTGGSCSICARVNLLTLTIFTRSYIPASISTHHW